VSKVYIVQEPMRRNRDTGEMEPMMDLSPAAAYGELVVLIKTHKLPLMTAPFIGTLRAGLKDFCDDDYILPTGAPATIAMAGAVAADINRGRINLLVWDKQTHQYIKISGDLRS